MTEVVVTLSSHNLDELHDELKVLFSERDNFDIIEFRGDYFEDDEDIIDALSGLSESNKKILYTYRTKSEGGYGDDDNYIDHLNYILHHARFDIIDIQYNSYRDMEFIFSLKSRGIKVLFSHHDFEKTPSEKEIASILEGMNDYFPDYYKLAYMPNNSEDVELLFEMLKRYKKEYGNVIITIAMGELGKITRVATYPYNSAFTYGCLNIPQAPGQVEIKMLREVYE